MGPDTLGMEPDTAGMASDTGGMDPDTSGMASDTGGMVADTAGMASDTGGMVADRVEWQVAATESFLTPSEWRTPPVERGVYGRELDVRELELISDGRRLCPRSTDSCGAAVRAKPKASLRALGEPSP